jgi:hypothetical protein
MRRTPHIAAAVALTAQLSFAQTIEVPNPSFEQGEGNPAGWMLSGGAGEWLRANAPAGQRALAITGTGEDSNYWRSGPLTLAPSTVYRLRFRGRSVGAEGGTPVTGPVFANRDLGRMPDQWTAYTSIFMTPETVRPDDAWLRFGQWMVKGAVAFDDLQLTAAQPVYRRDGNLVLGAGESLAGHDYVFQAPLNSESGNQSRPLAYHRCSFNSNRWVFGKDSEVVYRHEVAGRAQTGATVEVTVGWYAGGELVVEAGREGKDWRALGTHGKEGSVSCPIPADLLPSPVVWIRLRAQAKERVGQDSDPGSFQIHGYTYQATLDGPPADVRGDTHFVAVPVADPRLKVTVEGVGDGLPGGDNVLIARAENVAARPITVQPTITLDKGGKAVATRTTKATLRPGDNEVRLPYEVPDTGEYTLALTLGPEVQYRAEASLYVAELYNSSFGERLPGATEQVGLWWAQSGWKTSQTRPLPKATGKAVLVRAAKNEVDAAQLVVRPTAALSGFLAKGGALRGPGGAAIPAQNVEVLRVRYVPVTQPTDSVGVAAPWPDPLPPFAGPIDLAAGRNQPLWVRVKVPRDVPAGKYAGSVSLTAKGYHVEVPLQVEVYDFVLPDCMTCVSAYGFSPGEVWRYQRVTDPQQRRAVLDKYWANYSAHHLSPYNLAPLDPVKVTWPSASDWQGGSRDRTVKHAGQSALLVADESATAQTSSVYGVAIPLPAGGVRLRFWYKTKAPGGQFLVTFNHSDASDQWMSGRNNDMRVDGTGEWQQFDRTVTSFPEGAKSFRLTLWAALWADDGSPTGTVWYDDLSLQDAATGQELVKGGEFEPTAPALLKPVFDWTAWDAAMTKAIDQYHFNSFSLPIPGLGGGTFHSRTEPSLLGYGEDTPEYKAAFRSYVQAVQEHLREKGWLNEAFVYWFDEPDPKDYEFVMNGFRKLKEAAPDLTRMLTEQVEPALIGGPNLWCPVSPEFRSEPAAERRNAGDHFWWYVCTGPKAPYCTLFIDHPATELRVWLWQTWQRKIEGTLVWQTNYWTSSCAYPDADKPQNPYEDPMGWVSGYSTPAGTRAPWGNGDGRFVYPPEAAADAHPKEPVLEGPVDSIRWEMLRDGIEDYEYLVILRDLLKSGGDKLPAAERQRYAALLEVPEDITADMTTFTKDPAPIEVRREEVAKAIERLAK